MEYHYYEIFELPFVDFTLTHFSRWRNLLVIAKKHRFKNTTPSGFIQVVYYHLAIRNYRSAKWFLSRCSEVDNQVIFLKILLRFNEEKNRGRIWYNFFDSTCVNLIDLGVAGYVPAMLAIGSVLLKFRITDYDEKTTDERTSIIGKLGKIVQNLIEIDADIYNIDILKQIIYAIESKNLGDYIDPVRVWYMAQAGSNTALLRFLMFSSQVNNVKHFGKFSEKHKLEFKELLMERILEPNYSIIAMLLDSYPTILENGDNLRFELRDIVIKAIDRVYLYLVNGCEHMGIMESYLNFKIKAAMSLDQHHELIFKTILLKCYTNGYLFYYLYPSNDKFTIENKNDTQPTNMSIYYEIDKDDVTDEHVTIMVDLVINIFWSREICEGIVPEQGTFIGGRMFIFLLLLKINPLLWKAAVCVFGINFISAKLSFSQDVLNVYRNDGSWCFSSLLKSRHFHGHSNEYFTLIITKVLSEVSDHENIYRDELMEEIDVKTRDVVRNKCNSVLADINSGSFVNVYRAVFLLAEIDILSRNYRSKIDLHMKYRPGSKHYLLTRDSFCKRILN